jgi:hypothetical protein
MNLQKGLLWYVLYEFLIVHVGTNKLSLTKTWNIIPKYSVQLHIKYTAHETKISNKSIKIRYMHFMLRN